MGGCWICPRPAQNKGKLSSLKKQLIFSITQRFYHQLPSSDTKTFFYKDKLFQHLNKKHKGYSKMDFKKCHMK